MNATTQTGIPIIDCGKCGRRHPEKRKHCTSCNCASVFIGKSGLCLRCTA